MAGNFKPPRIEIKSLVGRTVAPAEDKFDGKVTELRIAVGQGYKKDGEWVETETAYLTYSAVGEFADVLREFGKGDLVEVNNAKLEVRTYKKKDDTEGTQLTLKFGTIVLLEAKGEGRASSDGFAPADTNGGF